MHRVHPLLYIMCLIDAQFCNLFNFNFSPNYELILIDIYERFLYFVGHPSGCGVHDEVSAWMDRIQNSAVEETEEEDERQDEEEEEKEGEEEVVQEDNQKRQSHNESSAGGQQQQQQQQQQPLTAPTKHKSNAKAKRRSATLEKDTRPDIGANDIPIETGYEFKYPYEKYSKAANWRASGESVTDSEWHWKAHERVRRAARPKEDYRNTCSLYIQSDPLLWSHIRDSIVGVSIH